MRDLRLLTQLIVDFLGYLLPNYLPLAALICISNQTRFEMYFHTSRSQLLCIFAVLFSGQSFLYTHYGLYYLHTLDLW